MGINLNCEQCGKLFKAYPYEVNLRNRRFCSIKCHHKILEITTPQKKQILKLYETDKLSTNDLAKFYNVSKGTIYNWLKKYEIQTRDISKSVSIAQTGKPHTEAHRKAISDAHIKRGSWQGVNHPSFKYVDKWKSRRSKGGKRADLEDRYFRSSWEANVARYFNWLIKCKQIKYWEYEVDTFEFPVKKGSKFYTPDFKVWNLDTTFTYFEVKGYMDAQSITKLKRMARYFPGCEIKLIEKKEYLEIKQKVGQLISSWE